MNILDNRETANKAVREWKSHHQETYSDFKRQVAAIGSGDLSLMERTVGLLDDCMPQNARDFFAYIFKYIMNPDSVADDQAAFSDYDQLAAECIFHHAMIKVDSSTGEIEETKIPDSDCIIIRTDDLGESFESMPSSMKCVLNDLINQMVASGIDTPLADQDRIALQNLALLVTKTVYVYSLLFVPEYLEQLYKRIAAEGEPLAYLLYALRQSNHIESCNYITFHRALQAITNKPLGGPDVPQRRYHELLADPKLLGSKGKKWQQAKATIDRWTVLFDKNDI